MDVDYLILAVRSRPGEAEAAFKARLAAFWSHLLRTREADFEKVYAEAVRSEPAGDALARHYLVEAGAIDVLEAELRTAGIDFAPADRDDLYSKYEAAPPHWFQLEH